jgi:hypothetical protein
VAPVIRGNSAYKIVYGPSWIQAETNSVASGGHLVTFNTKEELFWVQDNILSGNTPKNTYFTGLNDARVEGAYEWSSGQSSEWSNITDLIHRQNWLAQQHYASSHDYTVIYWGDRGFRADYTQEYRPDLYNNNFGTLLWSDLTNTWDKDAYGRDTFGLAEIPLTSSITFSAAPKEGAGVFTTSINLCAGTTSSGNLAEGATVYWKVSGITADDLATGALTGSGTISNGKLDLQHSLKTDGDTGEKFEVAVFSDAGLTQQIGTQKSEAILESSTTSTSTARTVVARDNSLYTVVDGPSWTEAESNAVKLGGHLATLNDIQENEFVANSFSQHYAPYIGLTDEGIEGNWRWISGQDLRWTNWAKNTPNGGTGENYSMMYPGHPDGNGVWDDFRNSDPWGQPGIAEIPFIQRGDSAYVIVQGPTWEEAEANAQALGGHLVTINGAEEEQFLLNNTPGGWIGYTDKLIEGQWNWVDGTPKGYERWDQNNPSNNNGAEHYAYLDVGAYFGWGAGWNDVVNNSNMRGIAEIKLSDFGITSMAIPAPVASPTLQTTAATSNQLILTFSEDIQIAGGGVLNPANITITVDGQTRKINSSKVTGSQLTLTLSGLSLGNASSISVSYNPPANGSNQGFITDLAGSKLAAITSQAVDTYSTSTNIFRSGIASAYKNLILTGTAPITGYGNTQNNTITGNDANNILDGVAGADTMLGGLGDDTYVVDNVGDQITELTSAGTDKVESSITYALGANLGHLEKSK